ncbi:hypothetical protein [Demequina pelophila]|uniref:hypothetical protein n=1 Tax=Demequina pelophila TaxID=1638984 RepID=UPI0007851FDB|nr:hypothetical protein [Demequina pelophila]
MEKLTLREFEGNPALAMRRAVETGQPVRVALEDGSAVIIQAESPRASGGLEKLLAAGLASPPARKRPRAAWAPVELTSGVDDLLASIDRDW